MHKMAVCVCGHQVEIQDARPDFRVQCSVCGRFVDSEVNLEAVSETSAESENDFSDADTWEPLHPKKAKKTVPADDPPLLLRLLLDPKSIQRLLILGGGLSILGLIAWLISTGVFEDPRILAVALGVGTATILVGGWTVFLRTNYRMAGQALTFLGCVLAPLNLWFYDAQRLLTVDGHLWVGGLVCCVLYGLTVWRLRDPIFVYAFEAGITLTAMLLLGDMQRADDSTALCLAAIVLAAISIHAEAAFEIDHPVFSRRKFGWPLFLSGQVQLAAGTIGLLALQSLDWTLRPEVGHWSHSHLAQNPLLAGGIWLVAAYLWSYSDLVKKRIGAFSCLAVVALALAEITLLHHFLPYEGLLIALSVTALVVQVVGRGFSQSKPRLAFVVDNVSTTINSIAFVLGMLWHFRSAIHLVYIQDLNPRLFAVAMLTIALTFALQAVLQKTRSVLFVQSCWAFSALAGWMSLSYGLDLPEVWFGPILASIGVAMSACSKLYGAAAPNVDDSNSREQAQPSSVTAGSAGELYLVLGELITFFKTLPWMLGSIHPISVWSLVATLLTVGLAITGSLLGSQPASRRWHRFAAAVIGLAVGVAWIRSHKLADYQKLELLLELLGVAWLGMGIAGRLDEKAGSRNGFVSSALWAGSFASTLPVLFCTLMHRCSASGPLLGDELGLITVTVLMVAIGCVLQLRATTTVGGIALSIYLAVLFGHLAYHPQVAVGIYLAIGGGLIFLTGVILSIYRDRLLALPSKIANREGIFQIIDWR